MELGTKLVTSGPTSIDMDILKHMQGVALAIGCCVKFTDHPNEPRTSHTLAFVRNCREPKPSIEISQLHPMYLCMKANFTNGDWIEIVSECKENHWKITTTTLSCVIEKSAPDVRCTETWTTRDGTLEKLCCSVMMVQRLSLQPAYAI